MRKLFTLCLLVFSLSASAQWQQTGAKVRYVNGLGIPTRDTAAGVLADSSQILIRPADSSLYIKYKRTWVKVGSGGTIGGSGTTNYIPKFTASTTLGNSQIFDNGTNVGIGTTSPGEKLEVIGRIQSRVTTTGAAYFNAVNTLGGTIFGTDALGGYILTNYSSPLLIYTNSTERMRITSGGNALIGTTTDNGTDKLQVSGSMNVSARATAQNLSVVGTTSTTGNIGIFNSSPNYALSVGDGTSTRQVVINGLNSGTAGGSSIAVQVAGLTTIMFGNKSNITGGAYDGQPVFGFGGSTNSLQFYNFNTLAIPAMISSGDRFLISTTTDNNTDKLQVNGSIQGTGFNQAYTSKTTTYTATTSDYFIDCTSGTFTVNLFTAVGNTGRILIIKNSGTGTITVDPNGTQTIDGATTQTLSTQWSRVHIISDGTNWKIISN